MRICRLDLVRYGHFTESVLQFPRSSPDIHIVFGPNEAGKSTALSAVEDFLFGIPHNSSLNFLHDYGSMRIGAVVEEDSETLEAYRRKGSRDTLLTGEDLPLIKGDTALAPFLAGADRKFFIRMFSLDHERLRQGGHEILEARDEVGQILFSAGSGVSGLRDKLTALQKEADALWASRRASHRRYYQAEDRLKQAESTIREHMLTANEWQEIRRAYEDAQEVYDGLRTEVETKSAELRKLSRIRRVHRDVQNRIELNKKVMSLGNVSELPKDALQVLEKAERDDAAATNRIETINEQLEAARAERGGLTFSEQLLRREDDIEYLHERRIQVHSGKADLPKRRAELASEEKKLRRLAAELAWEESDIDQLIKRIPPRSEINSLRALLNRQGGLLSAVETSEGALHEASARVAEIADQLTESGHGQDVSQLTAVIKVSLENRDINARITIAENELQQALDGIERLLHSLKPEVSDAECLASISVPSRETVLSYRDRFRDIQQRVEACLDTIRSSEEALGRHKKAQQRIAVEEHAVSTEHLGHVREFRDTGWSLIRRQYVESLDVPDEQLQAFVGEEDGCLIDAYENAVRSADVTADQRFETAEATARLAEISRQIEDGEEALETLRREEEHLLSQQQELRESWKTIWSGVPVSVLPPDLMLDWITLRDKVITLIEVRTAAEREVTSLRREENETVQRLLKELQAVGVQVASLTDQPLPVVIEAAADVQRKHEQTSENERKLKEGLRKAKADLELKRKAVEKAEAAWGEWQSQWADAIGAAKLPQNPVFEAVVAQLNVIDEMREVIARLTDLQTQRINKIEHDIASFEHNVTELVGGVAPDLAGKGAEEAVLELEKRLDDAKRIRELQQRKNQDISSLEDKITQLENSRSSAREIMDNLQKRAGVHNVDELRQEIAKSTSLRSLQLALAQVHGCLSEEGDGLTIEQLADECKDVDLDQVVVREEGLQQEIQQLQERLMESGGKCTEKRLAFEAIGGDATTAKAAADRQVALAEMTQVAEQYTKVQSAVLLLQWAIERYRREKQAPLLKRAGQLFKVLTEGKFSDLQLQFDEQDHAQLVGVRPKGGQVGVKGLSTGTADQLYLALRVASVEDYLERASSLPFVADDLFINFDDDRAAAGFKVLNRLAERTQVLFFTHHRHLVEIARKTLGDSISVLSLV